MPRAGMAFEDFPPLKQRQTAKTFVVSLPRRARQTMNGLS